MSFSANQFIGTLNTLEDSQESISSASKRLLSQYREADRVAETWKDYMFKKSLNVRRKLLSIYLLNHVVQQAKSQKMEHFHKAFSKVVPEVLTEVYPQFPLDLQKKVKRVADIWYDRGIFHKSVLVEIRSIIKKINESGAHGDSISSSSSSIKKGGPSSSSSSQDLLPPDLQKYLTLLKDLKKLSQSSKSLKERFEKSAAELDPASHVYEENYKTVEKIANLATDTTRQEMSHREQIIKLLDDILQSERKHLEQNHTALTEIEFTLLSKDPTKTLDVQTDNGGLPTYTTNENDNDSDSDGNKSSSSCSDSDDDRDSGIKSREKDQMPLPEKKNPRRSSHDENSDNQHKKQKTESGESPEVNPDDAGEYDPLNHTDDGTKNLPNDEESSEPITSNIQDLLSKLAN